MLSRFLSAIAPAIVAATLFVSSSTLNAADYTLYNVSYDPTRELYKEINKAFTAEYQQQTGDHVTIKNSHGGSGKQSRSVIDGAPADVVTLALAADIDAIARKAHLLPEDWQTKLPENSAPYTSTIVFLVRKGNPKGIHEWNDLIKPDVKVITPDPKSSGGARWAYLAAWGQALRANNNDEAKARAFVAELYHHVPVLDSGARAATVTFAQRGQGDVLLSWENEAYLAIQEFGDQFEVVAPKISILAEPPVAVVEKNAQKDGASKAAEAYLKFLYTPEAQKIIAKNFYRPRDPAAEAAEPVPLPKVELFTIADFGGWSKVQAAHFADGGIFDQISRK
jgi:sulfate/thiosulfate transport system substrate-binding protein